MSLHVSSAFRETSAAQPRTGWRMHQRRGPAAFAAAAAAAASVRLLHVFCAAVAAAGARLLCVFCAAAAAGAGLRSVFCVAAANAVAQNFQGASSNQAGHTGAWGLLHLDLATNLTPVAHTMHRPNKSRSLLQQRYYCHPAATIVTPIAPGSPFRVQGSVGPGLGPWMGHGNGWWPRGIRCQWRWPTSHGA